MTLKDIDAERLLISGVLRSSDTYLDICDLVTQETITDPFLNAVWACVSHAYADDEVKSVDWPILMESASMLGLKKEIEISGAREELRKLVNERVKESLVRRQAAKVRKLEIARVLQGQLTNACKQIGGVSGNETLEQIFALAEEPIFDLTSCLTEEGSSGAKRMGDGAVEYMQFLMENPRDMVGISTGMEHFDHALGGGVRANSLDIIAARPKTGKTQLVDNMGIHIAGKENIPAFNIDTEMTQEEHLHRIIANLAGVPCREIETGKVVFDKLGKKQVLQAAERLKHMPYYYECIIGRQFEEVIASMRRWVTREVGLDERGKAKPCVIIYDYLKMLSQDFASAGLQEHQALGYITTALKNFMGRYGVGCITFAQLNREGIDKEDTDAISGSDRIIHYCTSFTIYKKKTDEERAEMQGDMAKYTHKLVPIIGRHGEGLQDSDYINILADYKHGRIIEGPTRFSAGKTGATAAPAGKVVEKESEIAAF